MQRAMFRSRSISAGPGHGVRSETTQIAAARTPNRPASVSSVPASISQFSTRAARISSIRSACPRVQ
jgi:hypothetical protein